jgi:hypothetical protein
MSFNFHGLLNRYRPFCVGTAPKRNTIHERGRFHSGSFPIFQGLTDLTLSYAMKMPALRVSLVAGLDMLVKPLRRLA